MTEQEARELGVETALRQVADRSRADAGDVAARSDILSVHVALDADTKGLVNAAVLATV